MKRLRIIVEQARARYGRRPVLVAGVAGLVIGVIVGLGLSALLSPRHPAPTAFGPLCAVEPGVAVRPWTHLVLHHSAGDVGDAATFDRMHREERQWENGLGYDFVIGNGRGSGDGEIEVSTRWRRQMDGAHCKADGMNARAIGICFVGDFADGRTPTDAQIRAGLALVHHLAGTFDIPSTNVLGHGEVDGSSTQCPGRGFPIELMRVAADAARRR